MAVTINASTSAGLVQTADTSGVLQLQTANTTAVTVDASQNVGIGTTGSSYKLDVAGDIRATGAGGNLYVQPTTTTNNALTRYINAGGTGFVGLDNSVGGLTTAYALNIYHTGAYPITMSTNGTERMRIDSSGNVCIGTTSNIASGKTSILFAGATENGIELKDSGTNSGAAFLSFRNSSNTQIGSITRNGTTNAVLFNTTSDERLKSNVVDANPVLDKLMQVQVRQYDWTEGDLHQDAGFIAQELAPVLSGIVTQGKTEEDMWQLDYSRLTPYLTKAIQEQQTIINDLKARIETLEGAA
jgi:hypothetical protein